MSRLKRAQSRAAGTAALCALLAGCNVTPTQVLSLRNLLPSEDTRLAERLASVAWQLRFAGGEYVVYPTATAEGGIVFTNPRGLRVEFDGEQVVAIRNLPGAFGAFSVERLPDNNGAGGGQRTFLRAGQPPFTAACEPPRAWQLGEGRSGSRFECRGSVAGRAAVTRHEIERNARGEVVLIVATIVPGVAPLVLQRVNPLSR